GDISIPDFVGKKMADAKKLIEEKKLKVGKITYQSSDLPAGQVVDQYPKKDKSAKENTPIDLFISKKRTEPEKTQDASTIDDSEVKKEIKKEEKKNDNIKPKSDDPDKTKDKKKENTETVKPKESTEKPKDKKDVPKPPKEKQQ
ncbi:MAG: PASTA domain-containing protein, partial [Ignavibacteriae bacterium]|nr:PASTA domain-containing protein [Ignavibacteriota bacterium]